MYAFKYSLKTLLDNVCFDFRTMYALKFCLEPRSESRSRIGWKINARQRPRIGRNKNKCYQQLNGFMVSNQYLLLKVIPKTIFFQIYRFVFHIYSNWKGQFLFFWNLLWKSLLDHFLMLCLSFLMVRRGRLRRHFWLKAIGLCVIFDVYQKFQNAGCQ